MPILNYTTTKSADATLAEIQKILVKHGCRKITVDYDQDGNPSNLTFMSVFNQQSIYYSLPCNFDKIHRVLIKQAVRREHKTKEQAIRTGWRIIKDWIEAQMAFVETEMVDLAEVFMPYIITRGGERMYDYIKSLDQSSTPLKLIE